MFIVIEHFYYNASLIQLLACSKWSMMMMTTTATTIQLVHEQIFFIYIPQAEMFTNVCNFLYQFLIGFRAFIRVDKEAKGEVDRLSVIWSTWTSIVLFKGFHLSTSSSFTLNLFFSPRIQNHLMISERLRKWK